METINEMIPQENGGSVNFITKHTEEPTLKLCANGDIFVKGKLIENDKEVVDALREFLTAQSGLK